MAKHWYVVHTYSQFEKSVQTANTNFVGYVEGFFQPSANGTLQLGFRSEVSGSSVTVAAGSAGLLTVVA